MLAKANSSVFIAFSLRHDKAHRRINMAQVQRVQRSQPLGQLCIQPSDFLERIIAQRLCELVSEKSGDEFSVSHRDFIHFASLHTYIQRAQSKAWRKFKSDLLPKEFHGRSGLGQGWCQKNKRPDFLRHGVGGKLFLSPFVSCHNGSVS